MTHNRLRCVMNESEAVGGGMKQITIRGLSGKVERIVRKQAREKGLSLNKTLVSLLEKSVGVTPGDVKGAGLHHDLDDLSGVWTREDAAAFDRFLQSQR